MTSYQDVCCRSVFLMIFSALLPSLQVTHRRVCLKRSPALCLTSPASRWIPSPWTTRSGWTRWLWTCWKATWCSPTRLWRTLSDLTGWSDPGPPLLQELGGTRRRDGHPGGGGGDRDQRRSAAHSPLPQPDGLQSEVWKQLGRLLVGDEGPESSVGGRNVTEGGGVLRRRHLTENALATLEVQTNQDASLFRH